MRLWLVLCRLCALLALAVSVALYLQYLDPVSATFCGLEGGCEKVRSSGYVYFLHPALSIPLAGILGFAAVLFVSLQKDGARRLVVLTAVGAAVALYLLGRQAFVIGSFCSLCVIVDTAALAAFAFAWLNRNDNAVDSALAPGAWIALAALCVIAPFGWSRVRPLPPVPDVIRALYVPGKINVVEFADFECPFCRALHPVLKSALAAYPAEKVHFVRMNVPLDQHEHARAAARAYVCADQQGQGEAFADLLMSHELDGLAPRRHAKALGLDLRAFEICTKNPETNARVNREAEVLTTAGFVGLPTTYVGAQRLVGLKAKPDLELALEMAARGNGATGVPASIYWPATALLAGLAVWWGRSRRATLDHDRSVAR